ncbi:MAG TPA: hypothetical protein VIM14_18640 [Polyangia bacterium]
MPEILVPEEFAFMHVQRILPIAAFLLSFSIVPLALAQQKASAPLPEIRQLMKEVQEHQKQLEKVRENYTYSASITTQEIDGSGQVKKTETEELEEFFVNGHQIGRTVKKDGKPLDGHDLEKETERITKLVEKAGKTPSSQPLEGQTITIGRLLEIMDVRNPRRENYRGRPAIVFDFVGRKDAKTHGIAEDVSKKLQGTMWVDEADREVTHLDVAFNDNFHVAGGIVANVEKGSNFHFDQSQVNGEVWLPTGGEISLQMRVLLFKGIHQHIVVRDYGYKRFRVEAEQGKDAKAVVETKQ